MHTHGTKFSRQKYGEEVVDRNCAFDGQPTTVLPTMHPAFDIGHWPADYGVIY